MTRPGRPAAPVGLLAELTHRCPMRCPYCSNPLRLERRGDELTGADWRRVLGQARDLGVLQVHLSGGEPAARPDLEGLVAHCAELGLYSNLITSGVLLDGERLRRLADAGLDHVQLSLQHAEAAAADHIGGFSGGHARKLGLAREVVAAGLPLTVNVVVHRRNIHAVPAIIDLAVAMGADRLELAHAQYYGWALANRAALMPDRAQVDRCLRDVAEAETRLRSRLRIDTVLPDYHARWPKACMGGWGSRALNVTPSGKVLPCHAAETIPGLEIWSVSDRNLAEIWSDSPAFNAFRGTGWMEPPCTDCGRQPVCHGGCRCQALAITGAATAADPACQRSPFHDAMKGLAAAEAAAKDVAFRYRRHNG